MTPILNDEKLLSRLLYRDALMLVIDKPAGLPVHAGPKGGENLEQHFDALRFGLPNPPGLAHRLDRDTSGCLILGRHRKALRKLGALFTAGRIGKSYWAVVHGSPTEPEGRIDLPLRKKTSDTRSWWMETHPEGQPTVTDYRVMGQADGISWIAFTPRTGRTHQIRVHSAALGCPILGDPVYGKPEDKAASLPLHLHARAVDIPLYPSRPAIHVEAEPPAHMREALQRCGYEASTAKPAD